MSIGPLGAAGSPLAQTAGTELERAQRELDVQQRRLYHGRKAQSASSVGQPDGEDHETQQRDADGRRPWEDPPEAEDEAGSPDPRQSKDPSQQSGNLLDLTG